MASCGRTANRALILVLLAVALALAIIGVFMPFFKLSESTARARLDSTASRTNSSNSSAIPQGVRSGSMTMWELTYEYLDNNTADAKIELRSEYYTCKKGKTNIQIGEGFAVVTCVLCCANLILSIFTFFFSPVVRVPLAVYAFLSAACAGVTIGMLTHGYLHSWCPQGVPGYTTDISLKEDGWQVTGAGLPLFAVSAALSLAVSLMAAIGG